MMLYKTTKSMVHSADGDSDYFGIIERVLQRDTLTPHIFMLY